MKKRKEFKRYHRNWHLFVANKKTWFSVENIILGIGLIASLSGLIWQTVEKTNGKETNDIILVTLIATLISSIFVLFNSFVKPLIQYYNDCKHIYEVGKNINEKKVIEVATKLANLSNKYETSGYQWDEFRNIKREPYLHSPNVSYELYQSIDQLELDVQSKKDPLPKEARPYVAYFVKSKIHAHKTIFNGELAGLGTDFVLNHKGQINRRVLVKKTDYYTNIATNDVVYKKIKSKKFISYEYDGWHCSLSSDGMLYDMTDTSCANIIGVSTLAITSDHKMIINIQSAVNDVNENMYTLSGSGSSNFTDVFEQTHHYYGKFSEFIKYGMERELEEEIGVEHAEVVSTKVIGYIRLLTRGGKPDFFGISYLNIDSTEVLARFYDDLKIQLFNRLEEYMAKLKVAPEEQESYRQSMQAKMKMVQDGEIIHQCFKEMIEDIKVHYPFVEITKWEQAINSKYAFEIQGVKVYDIDQLFTNHRCMITQHMKLERISLQLYYTLMQVEWFYHEKGIDLLSI